MLFNLKVAGGKRHVSDDAIALTLSYRSTGTMSRLEFDHAQESEVISLYFVPIM